MSKFYRFNFAEKIEEPYDGKHGFLLTSAIDGTQYPLDEKELSLAQLFDGSRSQGEVLDAFYKLYGERLSNQELESFVNDLLKAGLLIEGAAVSQMFQNSATNEQVAIGEPVRPRHQSRSGRETVISLVHKEPREKDARITSPSRNQTETQDRRQYRRLKIIQPIPLKWMLPLGDFITCPAQYRSLLSILLFVVAFSIFGLFANSVILIRDLNRFSEPLTILQTLLLSGITVNLLGQSARSAAYYRLTQKVPRFGIAMVFSFVPRFYADLPISRDVKRPEDKRQIYASSIVATLVIFLCGSLSWLITKNSSTLIPIISIGIALLAAIRFVLSINPLANRPGYRLFASWIGYPGLRQRALDSIFNRKNLAKYQNKAGGDIQSWVLYLYGSLIITYVALLAATIIWFIGGMLEKEFSGTGVLLFIIFGLLFIADPINRSRRPGSKPGQATASAGLFGLTKTNRGFLTRSQRRRRTTSLALRILFIVGFIYLTTRPYIFEPSGMLTIKPASGTDVRSVLRADIDKIYVKDGQHVEKGMVLAKLSDDEERRNISIIEARIRQLQAKLEVAQQGAKSEEIALAEQQLKSATAQLKFSASQAERYRELLVTNTVSRQQYEKAEADRVFDAEKAEEARRNLDLIRSGAREEELEEIEAELAEQQAELAYSKEKLERTVLKATSSGQVVSGTLDYAIGDYMDLGSLLLSIEDISSIVAEIEIPESDISDVGVGAEARIKLWKYPDREFTGTVESISPNAETSDYGKVVRVQVRLPNQDNILQTGLTGHGKIIGPEMPAYEAFTRAIERFLRIEVWSWLP